MVDPAKLFSLASQKNDFNVIMMIDRQDDMIFSYQLCKKAFAKNPETVFNLPHIDKVLMNIVCEQKGEKKIFKYQDIKLDYCEQQKASLANNAEAYIDKILEAIYERSGGLSEDDTDLEVTPIADDSFSMTSTVSLTLESGFYLNHSLLLLITLNCILKKIF